MWRQNCFPVNSDSDQSISDEEVFDGKLGEDCVSLSGETQKKEGLQLQSQLELLKGSGEQIENFLPEQKHSSLNVGDDVEMPDFPDEAGFMFCPVQNLEEEVISDDEDYIAISKYSITSGAKKFHKDTNLHSFGSREDGAYIRSMVNEEADALVHVKKNASSSCAVYTKVNKSGKGFAGKAKQKFSFHYQLHKATNSIPSEVYDGIERSDRIECGIAGNLDQFLLQNSHGENIKQSDIVPADAEICRGGLVKPEMKKQTMADRFQEALVATSLSNGGALVTAHGPSSMGLFKKLQQIMQDEKERDTELLKKLQMGADLKNVPGSILVEILSRHLEAKLTVCCCSFGKNIEDSQCLQASQTLVDRGRKGTVIFSPRLCSNVDLEVGNLIHIYPPWEEVQVIGTCENIILSAYFSQSQPD